MYEKIFILNRKGQKLCVSVTAPGRSLGLAFVMHGLSGNKDQPHILAMAQAFLDKGIDVIRFDTTNTFGESEGSYADATLTNYYEDLEDVIAWSKTQSWYQEPFWLAGHSLGAICLALFAEKHPRMVRALAPISTVVSGRLNLETPKFRDIGEMKERGWIEEKRGVRLKYTHIEDRLKYDLLPEADKLTMPVLLIVGELDDGTPLEHQMLLYGRLPGKKEIHVIKGAPHTFREPEHIEEIRKLFRQWIDSVT